MEIEGIGKIPQILKGMLYMGYYSLITRMGAAVI